jgi:hypothetical protein
MSQVYQRIEPKKVVVVVVVVVILAMMFPKAVLTGSTPYLVYWQGWEWLPKKLL